MPVEIRRLVFTPEEVSDALADMVGKQEEAALRGVLTWEVTSEDPFAIEVVVDPGAGKPLRRPVSSGETVAALLTYCMQYSIPIPRSSNKAVRKSAGGLALDLRLGG